MAAASALIRPRRLALLGLSALMAVFATALGAGFVWFAVQARRPAPGMAPGGAAADGIVVLTGGAGRIELGLRLLAEGRAPVLLISGAGSGGFGDLLVGAGLDQRLGNALAPGQVTLGLGARSTRGNARETADWVAAHDIGVLIVVTSGYHMRRALIELSRTLPGAVVLVPAPLVPHMPDGHDAVPLRLLVAEYAKWLGVLTKLSDLVAREEEGALVPAAVQRGGG